MSEQNWGSLDKMSEVNFSPAETLEPSKVIKDVHMPLILSTSAEKFLTKSL